MKSPHEELKQLDEHPSTTREIVGRGTRVAFIQYLRDWLVENARTEVRVTITEDSDVGGLPRFSVSTNNFGNQNDELELETTLQQYGDLLKEAFSFDTEVRVDQQTWAVAAG
jgi:hypothetical protein